MQPYKLDYTGEISIHSSHTGRDSLVSTRAAGPVFQSTLPIREETHFPPFPGRFCWISIHSSHTGRDPSAPRPAYRTRYFNPLFPYGKRRLSKRQFSAPTQNFNPLFPYGKRPYLMDLVYVQTISIHSSHTGRDISIRSQWIPLTLFQSTLPIREETSRYLRTYAQVEFQSTLPIREETAQAAAEEAGPTNFNPLFPYGKRPTSCSSSMLSNPFQSTLPIREETSPSRCNMPQQKFQSTLPIREETLLRLPLSK